MKQQDLTITMEVSKSPQEVYGAINNVRGWWSEAIEGETNQLNDVFEYRYKDLHYSKQKLTEMIPGKRVAWLIEEGWLSFVTKKDEWTGTKIIFDISENGSQTHIRFTHEGLIPACECFDACTKGWSHSLLESLVTLINTCKGCMD